MHLTTLLIELENWLFYKRRRMEYPAFLRGFLPGILIGLFSSVLIFALWRNSVLVQRPIQPFFEDVSLSGGVKGEVPVQVDAYARRRRKEKRVEYGGGRDHCNITLYSKTQPVRPAGRSYLLLLLIDSSPRAKELRNTVRATWLNDFKDQDKYVYRFVIGTADLKAVDMQNLACENQQYGDLLLLGNIDEPLKPVDRTPSEKLLEAFLWALDNVEFTYVFKTHHATFVVLDPILKELELRESQSPQNDLLWGFFAGGVQATKEGRLGEKNWFLCTHYLPFPQGGGYVISHNLISMLGVLSKDLQHYGHDDIALGAWLSPFNGIDKKHDVRFNTGYSSRGCNNAYLVTSRETPTSMFKRYSYFKKTGLICEEEYLSRLSYVYNWTVSPNRCCVRQPGIP